MGGLLFGFGIYWMIVIVLWCMRNDGRTVTTGILAMKSLPGKSSGDRP